MNPEQANSIRDRLQKSHARTGVTHGPPDQEANEAGSPAAVEESANTSSTRGTGCAASTAKAGDGTAESP